MRKLSELPEYNFTEKDIENCFHVDFDQFGQPISRVPMSTVVKFITDKAKKKAYK